MGVIPRLRPRPQPQQVKPRLRLKPLFRIDHSYWHTAFFFEAMFSAMVITLTFIFDDILSKYMEERNMAKWQKYLLHMAVIFVCSLISIYTLCILFGYGEAIVPNP